MKRVVSTDNDSKSSTRVEEKGDKMSKESRRTLVILFISLVLDLLGFTVILPLMPSILEYYGRADGQVRLLLFALAINLLYLFGANTLAAKVSVFV